MRRCLLVLLFALPAATAGGLEPPTLEQIRNAEGQTDELASLLERWLDAYPASAHALPASDLGEVVAHLVDSGFAHHPATTPLARDFAERQREAEPFDLGRTAGAFSLAVRLLLAGGENSEAQQLVDEGLRLCRTALESKPSFETESAATSCSFLLRDSSMLNMRVGRYDPPEEDLEKAAEWLAPYPRSEAWIPVLNSSADLACWRGEVDRCLARYRRATSVAETLHGPDHPITAYGYLGLGWAAALADEWGTAREAFEKAETLWSETLGPEHPRLADVLVEYGEALRRSGNPAAAATVLDRAIRLREARLGPRAFDLPRALDASGLAHLDLGDLERAERDLERSADIRRDHLGERSVDYARSLNALAALRRAQDDSKSAEALLAESLGVTHDQLGEGHPTVAQTSLHLASLLIDRQPERAAGLALEARRALTRSFGRDHPAVGQAWWLEARIRHSAGLDPIPSALEAESIGRQHVRRVAAGLSERDLLNYLQVKPDGADLAVAALLASTSTAEGPRAREVWQSVARSRALIFDTVSARSLATHQAEPTTLDRARQALAYLLVRGPDERSADYAERLRAARERVEREERAHSRGSEPRFAELEIATLLSGMARDETLLAYRIFESAGEDRLAAFVGMGGSADVRVRDLGSWASIEADLRRWRGAFLHSSEADYRRASADLRRRVWDPVEPWLTTARCFVVPDGALFLLPLGTLPTPDGYLLEGAPTLHYLGAERDLLDPGSQGLRGGRVLVLGDPDFDEPQERSAGVEPYVPRNFDPLPGARDEVELVAEAWRRWFPETQVESFEGSEATEERWRQRAPGAVALHLATHGFIVGTDFVAPTRGIRAAHWRGVGGLVRRDAPRSPRPTLAGFALAHANRGATGSGPGDGTADGIVTLEEIRQLDLRSARLVVLSFCESGLGETLTGEGVFGFTRAFRSAGARSLVLALAPVSDQDSLRLMSHFYPTLLGEGQSAPIALQKASRSLLAELRREGQGTHPIRWGAMVSTGALFRPTPGHPGATP